MIRCPSCQSPTREAFIISAELDTIERRRRCTHCGHLVTTKETIARPTFPANRVIREGGLRTARARAVD